MTRSLFRKLAGFIAGMLALSFAAAVPAGATSLEEKDRSLLTIQTYAAYLAKEAPDVLPKFEALSASDKERYLELLANPVLYTDRAESLDGVTVGGNTAGLGRELMAAATRSTDRMVRIRSHAKRPVPECTIWEVSGGTADPVKINCPVSPR